MSTMARSVSAPLRRSRYSSVLESALIGLGREDAVVQSTRKPRKKRRFDASKSPIRGLRNAFSAPAQYSDAVEKGRNEKEEREEEEDPFAQLTLLKSHQKKKIWRQEEEEEAASSPAVTRSAAKQKTERYRRRYSGVLEMVGRTPATRSMVKEKKKWKRSSLEMIKDMDVEEDDDVVVQKKLFRSPQKKKTVGRGKHKRARGSRKAAVLEHWRVEWPPMLERKDKRDVETALLVLTGQVDGKPRRFAVGKREAATKFTSKNGEYVTLSGKLDRDAARSAGIPRTAMELMDVGIPAHFKKHLLPYAQKSCDNVKHGKTRSKPRSRKKKAIGDDKYRSPLPLIDEANHGIEAIITLTPIQDDETCSTPKPKKACALALTKEKRKSTKKEEPEPEAESEVWTTEQQEALINAKLKTPTTAPNFWAQVAQFVPGKSARDCQTKTFEQFRSPPTNRKVAKKPTKRANTEPHSAVPTKIARAGSNKFKKQVREFVEEYEKKHVDDLFETTPSKGLPELPEFDSIQSPELGTPSRSFDDNDSEIDDEAPGLLKKLSSRRRDDIDSYVLGINRQHVAGGGVMAGGKVRRVTSMATPVEAAKTKAMSAKKAVMLVEEVGSHSLKGVVSPGGTTYVRIEKDGSSSEDEEEDDCHSSEQEEDFDCLD